MLILFTSLAEFLKGNYIKIAAVLVLVFVSYSVYFFTTRSLRNLKTEIFSSYPFDVFYPHGGSWSVGYFMLVVVFLGLLMFLLLRGGFVGPV